MGKLFLGCSEGLILFILWFRTRGLEEVRVSRLEGLGSDPPTRSLLSKRAVLQRSVEREASLVAEHTLKNLPFCRQKRNQFSSIETVW